MKRRKIIYFIFVLSSGLITLLYLYNRFSIAKENTTPAVLSKSNEAHLAVGIIGDSWVAAGNMDAFIKNSLLQKGLRTEVYSSGQGGAKTKQVYLNLFSGTDNFFSSSFIKTKPVEYCIVCCGVNDSFGQFGKKYYSKHMCLIIKELLKYNIKPVVVELPEYGIVELYGTLNFINKLKNSLFAFYTGTSGIDNIKEYRDALETELKNQDLENKIILIDYDEFCKDYSQCQNYYTDYLHLTDDAMAKLSDLIAGGISKDVSIRISKN